MITQESDEVAVVLAISKLKNPEDEDADALITTTQDKQSPKKTFWTTKDFIKRLIIKY